MFHVLSIQADNGDSLLVSYGSDNHLHHILIDGGTTKSAPNLLNTLEIQRGGERLRLEALVVTHYDLDHIQGIIELLRDPPDWLDIADVWFNGQHHLLPRDKLGHEEGTNLSELIRARYAWNHAFSGDKICSGKRVELPGGMLVSVVSPGANELSRLAADWPAEGVPHQEDSREMASDLLGRKDTWPPGTFTTVATENSSKDMSVANGSSIALILEFEGRKAVLTGDAFSSVVETGIKSFWETGQLAVDLIKLSHHGSKRNTEDSLLKSIKCQKFLISTNGRVHSHPDNALIARILKYHRDPQLIFNYKEGRPSLWENVPDGWPKYQTLFPLAGEAFVRIEL